MRPRRTAERLADSDGGLGFECGPGFGLECGLGCGLDFGFECGLDFRLDFGGGTTSRP
jgi:hypothetical protein